MSDQHHIALIRSQPSSGWKLIACTCGEEFSTEDAWREHAGRP